MVVLLILLGGVLPLLMAPGLLFHYDATPKTLLLCVALLAMMTRATELPAELSRLWARASGRLLASLALGTAVWFGVAAMFSSRTALSFLGSGWREFGVATIFALSIVAVLVAAHLCSRAERVTVLLRAATTAGVLVALYGIAQYFDIDPFQSAQGYHALDGDAVVVRPPGTFGHADYFGWWMAIDFFCALAVIKTESRFWKAFGSVAACLLVAATLLTGTRSALAAIVVGSAALVAMEGRKLQAKHVWTGAFATALIAVFLFSAPGERLRARVVWAGHEPTGGARPLLWRDSLRMVAAKPLVGYGPESFPGAFAQWESDDLAHLLPDFHHESPHNVALDALTSAGIPGLLLVIGWALLAFRAARGALRSKSELAAPLAAGVLASAVAAMFSAAVMAPVLFTLLLLGALTAIEQPDRVASVAVSRVAWAGFAVPVAASVAAFACLLGVSDYGLAGFQKHPGPEAYRSLLRTPVPVATEDIYASRVLASSCSKLAQANQYDCWRTAIQAAARATETADDPGNAWYNLAQFTAAQNDVRGTQVALKDAIRAAPKWFKPHWALAELLARTGNAKDARAEAGLAAALDANHTPEFTAAIAQLKTRIN